MGLKRAENPRLSREHEFQTDPRGVEASHPSTDGSDRRGFRRTLVGLKRTVVVDLDADQGFRRTLVGLKLVLALVVTVLVSGFRRTLVGLKRGQIMERSGRRTRFRRTLVGLKPEDATKNVPVPVVSDGPSWG